MNSYADPFQRDEMHLFLAVVLHLAVGIFAYISFISVDTRPNATMLEGLPIIFGQVVTPGNTGGDTPKTLARSHASEAEKVILNQRANDEKAPSAVASNSNESQPAQPRAANAVQSEAQQSTPATVGSVANAVPKTAIAVEREKPAERVDGFRAVDSKAAPLAVAKASPSAALGPTIDLRPPEEVRPSRPVEALPQERVAAKEAVGATPSTAGEQQARLANLPGAKPALVPQIDVRTPVVVLPKPPEEKLREAAEIEAKPAEAKVVSETAAAQAEQAAVARAAQANAVPQVDTTAPQTPTERAATETQPRTVPTSAPPTSATAPVQPPAATTASQVAEAQPPAPVTERVAETLDETINAEQLPVGATPVPRTRAPEPPLTPEELAASNQEQPGGEAPPGSNTSGGAGTPGGTGTGGGSNSTADRARAALAGLPRLGQPSGNGTGLANQRGTLKGANFGALQARGSSLAQACLDRSGVFRATDSLSVTFEFDLNRTLRSMNIRPNYQLHRGQRFASSRLQQIENSLNGCREFKSFVLGQPGFRTFSFRFESGRQ
jgi:hypothetical protein